MNRLKTVLFYAVCSVILPMIVLAAFASVGAAFISAALYKFERTRPPGD